MKYFVVRIYLYSWTFLWNTAWFSLYNVPKYKVFQNIALRDLDLIKYPGPCDLCKNEIVQLPVVILCSIDWSETDGQIIVIVMNSFYKGLEQWLYI